jgi:hypothetical protein
VALLIKHHCLERLIKLLSCTSACNRLSSNAVFVIQLNKHNNMSRFISRGLIKYCYGELAAQTSAGKTLTSGRRHVHKP